MSMIAQEPPDIPLAPGSNGHGKGGVEDTDNLRDEIEVRAGEVPRVIREAQEALMRADAGIYQRGGQLVRIARLERESVQHGVKRAAGSVIIVPVSAEYLAVALARSTRWVKFDARLKGLKRIDPPMSLCAALLAVAGEWMLPALAGLAAAPTLRPDGSLLDRPGYDEPSGIFGVFDIDEFPAIKSKPTREEAQAALDLLDDLFSECAFTGGDRSAHASVAIAATVTAAVRQALPTAPAFGISAFKQSSGKTTLARIIAQVCTGHEPPVMPLPKDEAELCKTLLAILIAGDACVLIDNVARPVDSASLCAMLTNATYADRMLGVNRRLVLSTALTLLMTGNHLQFVGDLTTRVLLSVIDPQIEHPEAREFKRDVVSYVTQNRGRLLAAALTVPLAYLAAGEPDLDAPRSRFVEWDRLVRRPLLWLGTADPLATQADLTAADPVREELVAVLHAFYDWRAKEAATVAELVRAANELDLSWPHQKPLRPLLLEALKGVAGERNGSINARKLGNYLVRNVRRIEDGMRLENVGEDPVTHCRKYRVTGLSGL